MLGRLALVVGSVLFSLLGLELACRVLADDPAYDLLRWPNLVLKARLDTKANSLGRMIHDDRLGFVARPYFVYAGLTYDGNGLRNTPSASETPLAEPPILVVGDSYAHGDEVDDAETWPARLQALVGRRVINAALSGYGIDQMVLRAETMAAELKPAAIVLSFIADDVRRSEMKRVWGAEKPYFEAVDGKLVLRNTPVPLNPDPADTLDLWQHLFGRSALVDVILKHYGWQYEWAIDHVRVLSPSEGEQVVCLLMRRLAGLGLPTLVVGEYDSYLWSDDQDYRADVHRVTSVVLQCAGEAGLATLDLFGTIDPAVRRRGLHAIYRAAHPGPEGTRLTAQAIASALEAKHLLP